MSQVLIGIDAGTTVIKTVAFSLDGEALYRSSVENAVDRPEAGWAEQSMVTTWKKMAQTVSEVVENLDAEIAAVGVTGQGDGCWLVDENGDPVRPAVLWSDGRARDVLAEWQREGITEEVYDVCRGVQFPGSSLVIQRWLRENEPERYDRIDTDLFCKDWLKYKLTGELTTDRSDASLPYLDAETGEYSDEVLDLVDMPEVASHRPPLADGPEVVGEVTKNAAIETDLPVGTPVVSGFIDIAATAFGSGASHADEGSSIVGTTLVSQGLLNEPPSTETRAGFTLTLDGEPSQWTQVMAAMTGTPNLDWAIEEIMDKSDFNLVEEDVESIPIGSEGVLYLPYLSNAGERAPFLDANARAQFMGLTQEHTQAHLVRAVYEGISLAMRDCYANIASDTERVYLAGGGANSEFWCRMFADTLNVEIAIPRGEEFGAKGAALLAGVGVDEYSDLDDAVERTAAVATTYEPDPERVRQYRRWYDLYKTSYEAMFDMWEKREAARKDLDAMSEAARYDYVKKSVTGKDTVGGS